MCTCEIVLKSIRSAGNLQKQQYLLYKSRKLVVLPIKCSVLQAAFNPTILKILQTSTKYLCLEKKVNTLMPQGLINQISWRLNETRKNKDSSSVPQQPWSSP